MENNWEDHTVGSIFNGQSLAVTVDGKYFCISKENPNFVSALEALQEKDLDRLLAAVKPIEAVISSVKGLDLGEEVVVTDDEVLVDGKAIHGALVNRILEFKREGYPTQALVKFLANLRKNPSHTVVEEFYEWLENADTPMPITDDGHFLAYKKVRADFKDGYSGKLDYSVGNVVEMPRNEVDDVRTNRCSSGLHFCSIGYLASFGMGGANTVVLVKINPADVVSFPQDCKTSKGRCAKIEVVALHESDERTPAWKSGYTKDWGNSTLTVSAPQQTQPTTGTQKAKFFYSRAEARRYKDRNGGTLADKEAKNYWSNKVDWTQAGTFRWAVV